MASKDSLIKMVMLLLAIALLLPDIRLSHSLKRIRLHSRKL